jgi:hypothetical protein
MDTYALIADAIRNKQQVIATYNGHRREMCPHTLGHGKEGQAQALFYQFGGSSSSGLSADERQNWRCIPLAGLSNVEVREGAWHSAPNHTRPQTCVKNVEVEVSH